MATEFQAVCIFCIFFCLLHISNAQTCSNYTFARQRVYESCSDLPYLEAHLHWNYSLSTRRIHTAYRATQNPGGWIAWAINLKNRGMIGSQALVAFRNAEGRMKAYATPINSYSPTMEPGALSFHVSRISARYSKNEMTIFAVLGPLPNITKYNIVWQAGDLVVDNIPQVHATSGPHIRSIGEVNFQLGA